MPFPVPAPFWIVPVPGGYLCGDGTVSVWHGDQSYRRMTSGRR